MFVIFNADDFGLTSGVNRGIIDSCVHGVVKSSTLMVDMGAQNDALKQHKEVPELKLGLHVRLTAGVPVTRADSLSTSSGEFLRQTDFWQKQDFIEQELFDEISGQVQLFQSTGLALSHIDSHHHAHTHPSVLPVISEIAHSLNVPLRGGSVLGNNSRELSYQFCDAFYANHIGVDDIMAMISRYKHKTDVLEIMCHPAYADPALIEMSSYAFERETELTTLTSNVLQDKLDAAGVIVTDYSILS